MIRAALSHDIDRTKKTYQFFTKPIRALINGEFDRFKKLLATSFKRGNYWTFEDIIEKLEPLNLNRVVLFFLSFWGISPVYRVIVHQRRASFEFFFAQRRYKSPCSSTIANRETNTMAENRLFL